MKSLKVTMMALVVATSFAALAHDETGQTSSNSAAPAAAGTATTATPAPAATTSSSSSTLANAVAARTPEEMAAQSGLQLVFALDHWLGVGTFVDPKLYSYLAANLAFAPQYLFNVKGVKLAASLLWRATYEYTLPDVETGRRMSWYDSRIGLSAPSLFKEKVTGIGFTPSVGLTLPTSPESWAAGFIMAPSLGFAATRSFDTKIGGFDLRLGVGGSRSINTSLQNARSGCAPGAACAAQNVDLNGNVRVLARPGEAASAFVGMNSAWGANIGASVNWRITGELVASVSYTFIKGWREAAVPGAADAFTPKAVDSNGNPVARTGYGQIDRTFAVVGLSYQMNEHYSLDVSLSTIQVPLTATGQVRFPFFSFGALADNATSANFTLTAAY